MQSAWLGAPVLLVAILAAGGQPTGSQVCKFECVTFTGRIPLKLLQGYERMKCGKPSVLLTTKRNRTWCANPNEEWVLDAIRELDAKNVPELPGRIDKLLGSVVPGSTQAGHSASSTETFSTAAYETSTSPVMREDHKSSAVSSTLAGPQATKPSAGSTSKPEVIVSRTTTQPEPLANRSMPSYFTDGPTSFGEGLTSAGRGLEEISGSVSDLVVPPTSLGTSATKAVDKENDKATPTPSTPHLSSTIRNLPKKNSTSNDRLLPPTDQQGSPVTENPTLGLSTVPQRRTFTSPDGTHTSTNGTETNSVKNKSDIVSVYGEATEPPLSTIANRDAFSKSSSTLSHSGLPEEHFTEKSRGETPTPSPKVPLTFLPNVLARYQSHIISVVFLVFTFCIYLAITGLCAKSHICTRASATEMVRGLMYSKTDPQTSAYALQVL